jgi:hypothetical protein
MEVSEEVNGCRVRVSHAWAFRGHAAGNIVLAVPFHGINGVSLLYLKLSYHCYKVTSWVMDNGTVWP